MHDHAPVAVEVPDGRVRREKVVDCGHGRGDAREVCVDAPEVAAFNVRCERERVDEGGGDRRLRGGRRGDREGHGRLICGGKKRDGPY